MAGLFCTADIPFVLKNGKCAAPLTYGHVWKSQSPTTQRHTCYTQLEYLPNVIERFLPGPFKLSEKALIIFKQHANVAYLKTVHGNAFYAHAKSES